MPPTPMTPTRRLCPVFPMILRRDSAHGVDIRRHQLIGVSRKRLPRVPLYTHHAAGNFPALLGDEKERKTGHLSDRIASRLLPPLEFRPSFLSHVLRSGRDHRLEHLGV